MLGIDSVLLPVLVIPLLMMRRLSSGETPYWFFGLVFLLILAYLGLDIFMEKREYKEKLKSIFMPVVIISVIGSAFWASVVVRHQTAPVYDVHDIVLQQEAALRFLLDGHNPYARDYFGTPLEQWHYSESEINPALYHFVMMPWYLFFALPFYFLSIPILGYFDARFPLFFLLLLVLYLISRMDFKDRGSKRLMMLLFVFNPAYLYYFLEGRSDLFMFAFMFWSFYLLQRKRFALAGVPMALAFATKQSAWPIFPFYAAYLWFSSEKGDRLRRWRQTVRWFIPFCLVFSLIVLPFVLWDFSAFWQSTVSYLSGGAEYSYPVAGYGWGMVLLEKGIITGKENYYPFWLWQLGTGFPLMVFLIKWMGQKPMVWRLIVAYGFFTFVFWYFSRYFNNSHLGYLSMVLITAYFWQTAKNSKRLC